MGLLAVGPERALPQSGVLSARGFREGSFHASQVHYSVVFMHTFLLHLWSFVFVHHTTGSEEI